MHKMTGELKCMSLAAFECIVCARWVEALTEMFYRYAGDNMTISGIEWDAISCSLKMMEKRLEFWRWNMAQSTAPWFDMMEYFTDEDKKSIQDCMRVFSNPVKFRYDIVQIMLDRFYHVE